MLTLEACEQADFMDAGAVAILGVTPRLLMESVMQVRTTREAIRAERLAHEQREKDRADRLKGLRDVRQ